MTGFVHLRVHTEYSLVDSVVRVDPLVDALDKLGHAGLRDHRSGQRLGAREVLSRGVRARRQADRSARTSGLPSRADDREPTRLTLLVPEPHGLQAPERAAHAAAPCAGGRRAATCVLKEWLDRRRARGADRAVGRAGTASSAARSAAGRGARAPEVLDYWRTLLPQRFYVELQRLGRPGEHEYLVARGRARGRRSGVPDRRDERRLLPGARATSRRTRRASASHRA